MKNPNRKTVLELDSRNKIFKTIIKQPGICIRELERTLEIAMGELTYHLPILIKADLILEENDGYFRRFYSKDFRREEIKMLSFLRREAAKKVIPLLLKYKRINNNLLKKELSISKSTASWHLSRLKQNKLVEVQKEGAKTYYSLTDSEAVKKIYLI